MLASSASAAPRSIERVSSDNEKFCRILFFLGGLPPEPGFFFMTPSYHGRKWEQVSFSCVFLFDAKISLPFTHFVCSPSLRNEHERRKEEEGQAADENQKGPAKHHD